MDRRIPYVLTPKVSYHAKASILMWPQFVVVAVLGTAWIAAFLKGIVISPFLHLCTAALVAMSLVLILTERFTFPAPYTGSSDLPKAHTPLPGSSLTETP